MAEIKALDEMMKCPCGIITDQAIVWDYGNKKPRKQTLCHTCQKELYAQLSR